MELSFSSENEEYDELATDETSEADETQEYEEPCGPQEETGAAEIGEESAEKDGPEEAPGQEIGGADNELPDEIPGGEKETDSLAETFSGEKEGDLPAEVSGELLPPENTLGPGTEAFSFSGNPELASPDNTASVRHEVAVTNQILAQPSLEDLVNNAIDQIIKEEGRHISPSAREAAADAKISLVPNRHDGTLGTTSRSNKGGCHVRIAAADPAVEEIVGRHEANHLLSKFSEVLIPGKNSSHTVSVVSGLRHSSELHTPQGVKRSETGRGLNEGVTQRLAKEQFERADPKLAETAVQSNAYRQATALVGALQTLLGPEVIHDSYFSGSSALQDSFNELAGDKASYSEFLEACDKAISSDKGTRSEGVQEALDILSILENEKNK